LNATLHRLLTEETDSTAVQLLRYVLAGGIASVVDIGSFAIFATLLGIDYRIAVILSFTLGLSTNFTLSNTFVFQRKTLSLRVVYLRQYMSGLAGLAVNEVVMIALVEGLGMENLILGKVVATGCAFFVNFFLVKNFAFNHRITWFGGSSPGS